MPRTPRTPRLVALTAATTLCAAPVIAAAEEFQAIPLPATVLEAGAPQAGAQVKGPAAPDATASSEPVQGPAAPVASYDLALQPEPDLQLGYQGSIPRLASPLGLDHGAPEVRLRPAGPALQRP